MGLRSYFSVDQMAAAVSKSSSMGPATADVLDEGVTGLMQWWSPMEELNHGALMKLPQAPSSELEAGGVVGDGDAVLGVVGLLAHLSPELVRLLSGSWFGLVRSWSSR